MNRFNVSAGFSAFVISVFLAFGVVSCSDDSDDSDAIDVKGLWELVTVAENSYSISSPFEEDTLDWNGDTILDSVTFRCYIKFDGSYMNTYIFINGTNILSGGPEEGEFYYCEASEDDYTINGSTLTMGDVMTVNLTGDTLTLVYIEGEDTYTYTSERADESILNGAIEGEFCDMLDELL